MCLAIDSKLVWTELKKDRLGLHLLLNMLSYLTGLVVIHSNIVVYLRNDMQVLVLFHKFWYIRCRDTYNKYRVHSMCQKGLRLMNP